MSHDTDTSFEPYGPLVMAAVFGAYVACFHSSCSSLVGTTALFVPTFAYAELLKTLPPSWWEGSVDETD